MNLALNKFATQSSTWKQKKSQKYTADKAVDGYLNTFASTSPNQHTSWWKVDIQAMSIIEKIVLQAAPGNHN